MAKTATAATDDKDPVPQKFSIQLPYTIEIGIRGVTPFLFNRMDIESYDAEQGPGEEKKTRARPEYESMVWRTPEGELGLPVANFIGSVCSAGKYYKGPLGGNGGATTTLREGLVAMTDLASFGVKNWDCIDFRKANFGNRQRSPKPTYRPRLEVGWLLTMNINVVSPQLFSPTKLLEIVNRAGAVMGVGDGRKIGFGRYVVNHNQVVDGLPWQ
jgi:hypothetical protein